MYHTRIASPLWRPYYDRYPLTITDRVRYYRSADLIQKYALSVILISFCVYHTTVPGYHNHLCNPVTFAIITTAKSWRNDAFPHFHMLIAAEVLKALKDRVMTSSSGPYPTEIYTLPKSHAHWYKWLWTWLACFAFFQNFRPYTRHNIRLGIGWFPC